MPCRSRYRSTHPDRGVERRRGSRGAAEGPAFVRCRDDTRQHLARAGVMGDHLIVLHSAVRACPGYSRHEAPSMLMDGASVARETEHGRAVTAQLTRRQGTLEEAIEAGILGLSAAGLTKGIRRPERAACEDSFYNLLSLTPVLELVPAREEIADGLELMPDAMYRALEDVVEL